MFHGSKECFMYISDILLKCKGKEQNVTSNLCLFKVILRKHAQKIYLYTHFNALPVHIYNRQKQRDTFFSSRLKITTL